MRSKWGGTEWKAFCVDTHRRARWVDRAIFATFIDQTWNDEHQNASLLGLNNKRLKWQRVLQASFAYSSLHMCASVLEIGAAFAFNYYGQFDLNSTIICSVVLPSAIMACGVEDEEKNYSTVQVRAHTNRQTVRCTFAAFINEDKCKIRG